MDPAPTFSASNLALHFSPYSKYVTGTGLLKPPSFVLSKGPIKMRFVTPNPLTDHADGKGLPAAALVVRVAHDRLRHHPEVLRRRQPHGGRTLEDGGGLGLGAVQQQDPHLGRRDLAHVPTRGLGHLEDALHDEVPEKRAPCELNPLHSAGVSAVVQRTRLLAFHNRNSDLLFYILLSVQNWGRLSAFKEGDVYHRSPHLREKESLGPSAIYIRTYIHTG